MNRLDLDYEWKRVRVAPGTLATDRYSWLRPAAPSSITAAGQRLLHGTPRVDGTYRYRALRIDEAHAVVDVQYAVDDVHTLDRAKMSLRRYFFHTDQLLLNLVAGPSALPMELVATEQNLGVRYWWSCPSCGRRRRYVYYVRLSEPRKNDCRDGVLGCRQCLGLTYRSRARHRCDDHDRERAFDGDLKAAARVLARGVHRHHRDEVFSEELRRRLLRHASNLAKAGRP